MDTVVAGVPVPYTLAERQEINLPITPPINPWIIAVTFTLATFMELLDTAKGQARTRPPAVVTDPL